MKRKKGSMKIRKFITNCIVHIFLAILGFIWVLPIFFVILTSLRKEAGQYKSYIFPRAYTLDNYKKLFDPASSLTFGRWFNNTLIVAIFTCIFSAFFVLCVAYVMSRLRFKMRKKLMNIAMILGMFPSFMAMYAIYFILKGFGLLEAGPLKLVALVMVYSGGCRVRFPCGKRFF